jgi:hypothetical protein
MSEMKVLVLDGHSRATLEALQSLAMIRIWMIGIMVKRLATL